MIRLSIPNNKIKENSNFIVSNIILNQKQEFTLDEITKIICNEIGYTKNEIEATIKKALIRMRDDGFISVLGYKYKVIDFNI